MQTNETCCVHLTGEFDVRKGHHMPPASKGDSIRSARREPGLLGVLCNILTIMTSARDMLWARTPEMLCVMDDLKWRHDPVQGKDTLAWSTRNPSSHKKVRNRSVLEISSNAFANVSLVQTGPLVRKEIDPSSSRPSRTSLLDHTCSPSTHATLAYAEDT
jgi:hypothetical protein